MTLSEEYFKLAFGIDIYTDLVTFCQRKWYLISLFLLP